MRLFGASLPVFMALLAMTFSMIGSSSAAAQTAYGQGAYGHNSYGATSYASPVATAANQLAATLSNAGYGSHSLRAEAQRFASLAAHPNVDSGQLNREFRRLRRVLHRSRAVPSEHVLDAFYELAFAVRTAPVPTGQVVPQQPSRHGRGHRGHRGHHAPRADGYGSADRYYFEGSFENVPVRFSAPSIDALKSQCARLTSSLQTTHVDDVQIFGARHRNGPGYWTRDQLCTMAAANARTLLSHAGDVVLEGRIETIPFRFTGSPAEVRHAVRSIVPRLIGSTSVDDIWVNGRRLHNGPAYWSAGQVAALLENQVPVTYQTPAYALY